MFTVALIGGDGAGKTTVANAIMQASGLPIKYLYMGLSTRSNSRALPTSRLVLLLKQRMYRKRNPNSVGGAAGDISANDLEYAEDSHGWLWNAARFLNRLAEAWYRQIISIGYQVRGNVVLYDRHFFFDTAPGVATSDNQSLLLFDRLLFWFISHLYPRPSLTIFLDASPELLYSRKHEASPEYLARQRQAFLAQGQKLAHFIQVDAAQPLDAVIGEVIQHIKTFYALHRHGQAGMPLGKSFDSR